MGLGYISPRHFDAIEHVGGKVLITCDLDKGKAKEGIPHYTQFEFMAADPAWDKVDTVVICTPNDTHLKIAEWAIKKGRKVICEKPLAIESKELVRFAGVRDIFCVLQLRHHKVMEELKKISVEEMELHVAVKRDKSYWEGWKGKEERSGGILFNIGVHYFDALLELLGDNCHEVTKEIRTRKKIAGSMRFFNVPKPVRFSVSVDHDDDVQDRYLLVNGTKYRFSDKDNLSQEDLHRKVYEEFMEGRGVRPGDLIPLTRFVEKLKRNA